MAHKIRPVKYKRLIRDYKTFGEFSKLTLERVYWEGYETCVLNTEAGGWVASFNSKPPGLCHGPCITCRFNRTPRYYYILVESERRKP